MKTKNFFLLTTYLLIIFSTTTLYSQIKVGVDADLSTPPHPSSVMEVVSQTKGFLPPRLTKVQRDAIAAPAEGLTIYNTTESCMNVFDGTIWNTYCELRFSTACNCVEYLMDYGLATEAWIAIAPPPDYDRDWLVAGTNAEPQSILDTIYTQGRVGIGTASPTERLHVNGNSFHEGLIVDINGNSQMFIRPNDGTGNYHRYWNTLGTLTSTRTADGVAYQEIISVLNTDGLSGNYRMMYGGYDVAGSPITWKGAYTIRYDNGYLGVHNNNPQYTLDVTGTAHADTINVNNNYILPVVDGTSDQVITTDGAGVTSWATPVLGVTAGPGLTGGGTSGTITLNAAADNGLNVDVAQDKIQLGGPLTENTTITQGAYNMVHNLSAAGDFEIQDNGSPIFNANSSGNVGINTNNPRRLFHVDSDFDNVIDSTFQIRDDGNISIGREVFEGIVNISTSTSSAGANTFEAQNRAQLVFRDSNGDRSYATGFDTGLLMGGNWVDFNTAAIAGTEPTADFYLNGNGSVGLGTFRPRAKLHVASTSGGFILQDTDSELNGATHNNSIQFHDSTDAITGLLGFSTNVELLTIQNRNDNGAIGFYAGGLFERMRITSAGNVGIGVVNPTTPLQMGSGARVTAAGVWTNASDARLKTNVQDMRYGLKEVMKLRAVNYDMKKGGTPQIGFLAQEVQNIIPEVISGREGDIEKGETLGLSYGQLLPVLTKAIQEQQKVIEQLQADLETQNKTTTQLIRELQSEISALKEKRK